MLASEFSDFLEARTSWGGVHTKKSTGRGELSSALALGLNEVSFLDSVITVGSRHCKINDSVGARTGRVTLGSRRAAVEWSGSEVAKLEVARTTERELIENTRKVPIAGVPVSGET